MEGASGKGRPVWIVPGPESGPNGRQPVPPTLPSDLRRPKDGDPVSYLIYECHRLLPVDL